MLVYSLNMAGLLADLSPVPLFILLSGACLHCTISVALVDCVYDLAAYRELLAPLREEVERVLKEDGGWRKGTPAKLEMMDS